MRNDIVPLDVLVKRYRQEGGLTQETLAERAGISVRTLISLEQPQQRPPRTTTLALIADALALSAEQRAALFTARQAALPAPATQRFRLPRLPITLIGRDAERQALGELLAYPDRRLVTVTGTAGVGKTSLALVVAAEQDHLYADGGVVLWLAPITTVGALLNSLIGALGEREHATAPLKEQVIAALAERHLLLLFDNAEHLPDLPLLIADLLALSSTHIAGDQPETLAGHRRAGI